MSGGVYVIGVKGRDIVKIGSTTGSIVYRIRNLQHGSPEILYPIEFFHTDEPKYIERRMHEILSEYRYQGEWFNASLEDIKLAFEKSSEELSRNPSDIRENRENIGIRIRETRESLSMTKLQLARLIGKTEPYITRLENQKDPDLKLRLLRIICRALGVTPNHLLGWEDIEERGSVGL